MVRALSLSLAFSQLNTLTKVSNNFDDVSPLSEFASRSVLGEMNFKQDNMGPSNGQHASEVKSPA